MPIEKEDLSITTNLDRPSRERITKYTEELNLCGPVTRGMKKVLLAERVCTAKQMVSIAADVQLVVAHLQPKVGSTWQQASSSRSTAGSGAGLPEASNRRLLQIPAAT
eukprot:6200711-Pleurochrysis_carterae.AAC.1